MIGTPRSAARLALVLSLSMCALVVGVTSAAAHYSAPKRDKVIGLGTNNPPLGNIAAFVLSDAFSGPSGELPAGRHWRVRHEVPDPVTKFTFNAGVPQCLRVSGNMRPWSTRSRWTRRLPGDLSTVDATRVWVQDNGFPSKSEAARGPRA